MIYWDMKWFEFFMFTSWWLLFIIKVRHKWVQSKVLYLIVGDFTIFYGFFFFNFFMKETLLIELTEPMIVS